MSAPTSVESSISRTPTTTGTAAQTTLLNPVTAYLRFRRAKIVTVEPVLFLYMFGIFLSLSIGQEYVFNWFGRKMLREHANLTAPFNFCVSTDLLNEMVPRNETDGKKAGDVVQTQASLLSLAMTLLGQLPSVFAALVYGPLTDRVGRKPVMLLMGSAGALSGFLYTLAVYLEWSIYWFVPLTLIVALAGGIPGILTIVYAYVADVSSTKWLTLRLGIVESMVFFGSGTSLALGGVWLQSSHCKFVAPYAIYCIANILILVYVLFLLPESLTRSQRKAKFTGSSGLRHIARSFQIFFTRNEYSRWRLWCVVCSMFIIYLVFTGASEISTLFLLHAPLKWTPGAIGIFQAMSQLSYGLSIFLIIPLFVYLRVPDALILLIGVLWGTVCYLLTGFVRNGWEMYAGQNHKSNMIIIFSNYTLFPTVGVVQGVESIVGPPIRSTISKAVALKDQGWTLHLCKL